MKTETTLLDSITRDPIKMPDACVIWLHGLGANGYDFADIVPSLALPEDHTIRFVFPHAPERPVTLNANMVMPAWFDIFAISLDAQWDSVGIALAARSIEQLVEVQVQQGIARKRIVLVGFSQGGALALYTALRATESFAGVAGLSTYLPLSAWEGVAAEQMRVLPIFLAHGLLDPIVPYWMGEQSRVMLEKKGYPLEWRTYSMPHTVCLPECQALGEWFLRLLG